MHISDLLDGVDGPGTTAAAEAARSFREAGSRVLELRSSGTPTGKPADHVIEAAVQAARDCRTPPTNGFKSLREAISCKLQRENRIPADPETEILVTTGAKEAIFILMAALLSPGDEVLLHEPNYVFDGAIRLHGGVPLYMKTGAEDGFSLHLEEAGRLVSPRTRLLILCNPVNPTGHIPSEAEVEAFGSFADRYNLILLSDESYEKYVYDEKTIFCPASHPDITHRVVTIQSFSKGYSMTAYRIGYMIGPAPIISVCRTVLEWINIQLNPVSQMAAFAALTGPQGWVEDMLSEWWKCRQRFHEIFTNISKLSYRPPQATGFFFLDIRAFGAPSSEVSRILLQRYGIPSVPGSVFHGEGYIRIPFGGSEPVQNQLGTAIANALEYEQERVFSPR